MGRITTAVDRAAVDSAQKVSHTFTISRVWAILSVITAHATFRVDNACVQDLLTSLGSVCVVMFFIISGYYFNPVKYGSLGAFLKPKVTSVLIPWLFFGTFVYVESALVMHKGLGLLAYGKFLLGHGSYLYYLTVLILCYVAYFYGVKKGRLHGLCAVSLLVTVASLQLTAWGAWDVTRIGLTDYLNPLNWIGYFCIGVWLKRADVYRLMTWCRRFLWLLLPAYGGIFALSYLLGDQMGYFGWLGMPLQLVGVMIIVGVSSFSRLDCKPLRYVSKASFGVYLLHMFSLPVVEKVLGYIPVETFLSPLVTLAATAAGFFVLQVICDKIKLGKVFRLLSGVR
jgi:surface polysaccharide O-acyltransferase-like enzyme